MPRYREQGADEERDGQGAEAEEDAEHVQRRTAPVARG